MNTSIINSVSVTTLKMPRPGAMNNIVCNNGFFLNSDKSFLFIGESNGVGVGPPPLKHNQGFIMKYPNSGDCLASTTTTNQAVISQVAPFISGNYSNPTSILSNETDNPS